MVRTSAFSVRSRRFVTLLVVATLAVAFSLATAEVMNVRTALGAGGGGGGLCAPGASTVCAIKGHNAFADFGSVSADGCIISDVAVQAFEAMAEPGHNATTAVFVNESSFNTCNGTTIEVADNFDSNGNPIFTGTAQFSSTLDTATVAGSALMFDPLSNTTFTSTIDVSWKAYGPTTTYIDSFHSRTPGYFIANSHSNASTRSAVASGAASDEFGANLAASPTLNALVQNAISGSVFIVKS